MSENRAAKRLVDLIPAIMQRWDDRVRAEVSPAAGSAEIVLRDSLAEKLAVMARVLGDKTDPRTAARDLAYLTVHGKERANQTTYSLEELTLEFFTSSRRSFWRHWSQNISSIRATAGWSSNTSTIPI